MKKIASPADYVDEFCKLLKEQLIEDQKRWGDTWKTVPAQGMDFRIVARINEYLRDYDGKPDFPWLKVAGNALIGHLRQNHPELEEPEVEDELEG
jgi:hypothetical protein